MNRNTVKIDMAHIGKLMQDMVRRAIEVIRMHAHNPVPQWKLGYEQKHGDTPNDFATEGDIDAQELYRGTIITDAACVGFGIIGEEGLAIPCTHSDYDVYFTIDPLDGTKAYERKQSNGVGTMIALVVDGEILAVYIGDVNTGEIFGYAREHMIDGFVYPPTRYRFGQEISMLDRLKPRPLTEQYLYLREAPHQLGPVITAMLTGYKTLKPLFKDLTVDGGSIGTGMTRVWCEVVGMLGMLHKFDTPWDSTPTIGINRALGFVTFRLHSDGTCTEVIKTPTKTIAFCDSAYIELVLHRDHIPEFKAWVDQYALLIQR